ncbi:MAG: LytTR family DNA-binding domain-containing protein [Bacteroidales bacterium]
MAFINRKIPPYIYDKSNIFRLIIFTALFALIFINIYQPFGSKEWYPKMTEFVYFLYSSLFTLTGILVVVISRTIMYYWTNNHTIAYWSYIIWIIVEICLLSVIYTFISYSLDNPSVHRTFWGILKKALKNTSLILLLPYLISHLYFNMKDISTKLKKFNKAIKSGFINEEKHEIIAFKNESGEMKLSIRKKTLLYIESADNYVNIWYKTKRGITSYLLRNSMKQIEMEFLGTNIIRCHRSYIVNLEQVSSLEKIKQGIYLNMEIDKVPKIPVSKSYTDIVTKCFFSSIK